MKQPSSSSPSRLQVWARIAATVVCTAAFSLAAAAFTSNNHLLNDGYLRSRTDDESTTSAFDYTPTLQKLDRFLQNDVCDAVCCEQFQIVCESSNPFSGVALSIQIIMIIGLILFSALFSGLTLGLMSLDKTGLEIVMEGDDPIYAEYARKIYPLRKNGNLLLCTLLLGNVAVNSLLSILLADKAGGIIGFLASTFIIVRCA
jgi:hypothetical protein